MLLRDALNKSYKATLVLEGKKIIAELGSNRRTILYKILRSTGTFKKYLDNEMEVVCSDLWEPYNGIGFIYSMDPSDWVKAFLKVNGTDEVNKVVLKEFFREALNHGHYVGLSVNSYMEEVFGSDVDDKEAENET